MKKILCARQILYALFIGITNIAIDAAQEQSINSVFQSVQRIPNNQRVV